MKRWTSVLFAAVVVLGTVGARADVAPTPNMCGPVDSACSNAGPKQDQPGVCSTGVATSATTCGPGAASAPALSCLYCEPKTEKDAGGGEAGAINGATTPSSDGDGGCSIARIGTERSLAGLMLGLGVVGLAVARKRANSNQ